MNETRERARLAAYRAIVSECSPFRADIDHPFHHHQPTPVRTAVFVSEIYIGCRYDKQLLSSLSLALATDGTVTGETWSG